MAEHFSYLKRVIVKKSTDQLLDFLKQVHYRDTVITDLRRVAIKYNDNFTVTVTRCFIRAPDSGVLEQVGWVLNDHVQFCLFCTKEFGSTRWKHHCRACGNLICSQCSKHSIMIVGKEDLGKLKVCKACFKADVKAIQAHDSRDVGQSLLPGSPLRSTSMDEGVERVVRKPSVLLTNQVETKRPFQKAGGSNSPIKHSAPSTPNTSTTASKSPASTAIREADELILPELHVIPRPGYVIKTRRASNNPTQEEEKVFINVYHHESIVDKKLALHEVASPTTSVHDAKDNTTSLFILPKLYLGVATDTKDKEGNLSSLYNVVISSDYFAKDAVEEKKSTDVSVVQKVIEVINKTYQDNLLEDEYVRPRVKCGYKGDAISREETFILSPVRVSTIMRIRDDDSRSVTSKTSGVVSASSARIGSITNSIKQVPLSNKALSHNSMTYASLNAAGNGGSGISLVGISSNSGADSSSQLRKQPSTKVIDNSLASGSDEVSVISDATFNTTSEASVFTVNSKQSTSTGIFGSKYKQIINEDMMKVKKAENISVKEVEALLAASTKDPHALLGWQVKLHIEGQKSPSDGIFIVTGLRKNTLRKTEYRLSTLNKVDLWVKLKRSEAKGDVDFSPLRFVINFV